MGCIVLCMSTTEYQILLIPAYAVVNKDLTPITLIIRSACYPWYHHARFSNRSQNHHLHRLPFNQLSCRKYIAIQMDRNIHHHSPALCTKKKRSKYITYPVKICHYCVIINESTDMK